MLVCGLLCLVPAMFSTVAYYAHIWSHRSFWDSPQLLKLLLFSVPVYGALVGGPIAMISAAWALRLGPSLKCLRIALAGSTLSFGWSLLPLIVRAPDPAVQLLALVTGGASLFVLVTSAWQALRIQDRRVA
jgi:hypothetical protein